METVPVVVKDVILKPVDAVFEAIVNPDKLSNFFISKTSGPLKKGTEITWFVDDAGVSLTVLVTELIHNSHIAFDWTASGRTASVEIKLEPLPSDRTSITITESHFPFTMEGVQMALGQTQGWTDFICCMKAYLYGGINLREGRNELFKNE